MLKSLNTTKLIFIAIFIAILAGCEATPTKVNTEPVEKEEVSLASVDYTSAQYLTLAMGEINHQIRDRYVLLAAHAYINEGNIAAAENTLNSLKVRLSPIPELLAEFKYLSARVLELNATALDALSELNYPQEWRLANWQYVSYYQLKARLYQKVNQPFEQAKQLSLLSQYLPTPQTLEVNDTIWQALRAQDAQDLLRYSQTATDPTFSGWLQLAYIAKHYAVSPNELLRHLASWQQLNPSHPAAIKLPTDLEAALNTQPYQPKIIGVLLPLSGKRAAVADPIKQGIIANYLNRGETGVKLRFFDTALGAQTAYQQALSAGSDFIVGPLLQSNVQQLQNMTLSEATAVTTNKDDQLAANTRILSQQLSDETENTPKTPVPQLFLNHLDKFTPDPNRYYFALSPIDEALDAAHHLYDDGVKIPLILASNDPIGHRMADSFNREWQKLTNTPAQITFYDPGNKMQTAVSAALGVTESKSRIAELKKLLPMKVVADFRSRRDIDAIYMISGRHDLPLLKPFIDVNFSVFVNPVPLYTTSRSRLENHNQESTKDLDKLSISDIPWLITPNDETQQVKQIWPKWSNSKKRLYVMGYDALDLVDKLAQMRALPGYQFSGRSGVLSVQEDGTINRQLSWGRYQRGILRPL